APERRPPRLAGEDRAGLAGLQRCQGGRRGIALARPRRTGLGRRRRRGTSQASPPTGRPTFRATAVTNFLAIETSCDETAAAVFTDEPRVLSSVIASQTDLHARFGGVVPEVAARAHLQRLLPVIDEALRQANLQLADVHCVAVHNTPGLVGALLVRVSAAQMLSLALGVPLVRVNPVTA